VKNIIFPVQMFVDSIYLSQLQTDYLSQLLSLEPFFLQFISEFLIQKVIHLIIKNFDKFDNRVSQTTPSQALTLKKLIQLNFNRQFLANFLSFLNRQIIGKS